MLPSLTLALLLLPAQADSTKAKADAIAPFVGAEVAAILHVDLAAFDFEQDAHIFLGPLADDREMAASLPAATKLIADLKKAGAGDAYLLIDPLDLPGIPLIVMPHARDPEALRNTLAALLPQPGPTAAVEVVRGAVVAGTPEALARVRQPLPVRPGLAEAFAATGDAPVRAILLPSQAQRRALEEALPEIPRELGGGSIAPLSEGLKWAVATLRAHPRPEMRAIFQADSADSAKAMHEIATRALDAIKKQIADAPQRDGAPFSAILTAFEPDLRRDQIVIEISAEKAVALIAGPVTAAREAARRNQCTNNLKQIALALHNYHDSYGSFPPAYSTSKDGKPLLSWRVLILPYLEQQPLYSQFRLDEPWDSAHNKPLIERMPMLYACPDSQLFADHKCSYLAPSGKATIFPGADGVKLQTITDGTSNTVMVVEANDQSTVIWTQPDDWEVGDMPTTETLTGHHPGGFNVSMADGSIRFLKDAIDQAVFKAILTRNGGEAISADSFD